jgi:hypothetical protein
MVSKISHTSIDCHDAFALSQWWKQVIGYSDEPDDPNLEGHQECLILDPVSGHRLKRVLHPAQRTGAQRRQLTAAGMADQFVSRG